VVPIAIVLTLGGFVAAMIGKRAFRQGAPSHGLATADTIVVQSEAFQGEMRQFATTAQRRQGTSPEELRRRVANLKPGSYIDDIIFAQDSALYRWPDRIDAVHVYVEPWSPAAQWNASYPELARGAFSEWSDAGFPFRFDFVVDSASADIKVRWTERFPASEGQRIGVTERIHTTEFWIAAARIQIANHDSTGRLIPARMVGGILRHEIGHALGLNHANDATSVMYRESASTTISDSDRATLRLLYLIPPGSLR
jgi:predicted Zn-dependent protease